MPRPQTMIMAAGAGILLLGVVLFIWYPVTGSCTSPVLIKDIQFCVTSPGSICVLVGAALLIIGYLGMSYLERKSN